MIKRILKDISIQLKKQNLIEKRNIMVNKKFVTKNIQSIYEYFNNYTEKQVDEMLSKLTKEERLLITLRYGNDLKNPVTSKEWNNEKSYQYYRILCPKMKKLLASSNYKQRVRGRKKV